MSISALKEALNDKEQLVRGDAQAAIDRLEGAVTESEESEGAHGHVVCDQAPSKDRNYRSGRLSPRSQNGTSRFRLH